MAWSVLLVTDCSAKVLVSAVVVPKPVTGSEVMSTRESALGVLDCLLTLVEKGFCLGWEVEFISACRRGWILCP